MPVSPLYPVKPYDFDRSAMIFSGGDRQIRTYEQGIFCQALEIQGMPVLVEIFSKGTVEEPELDLSVHTDNSLSKGKIVFVRSLISSMFNLNEDLTPFYQAMETDAIMMDLICKLRGLKAPTTPTVFEALVDSVIEQQISLKAAHSIEKRLIRAVGSPLAIENRVYYCYPAPITLSETTDTTFRACGLTRRKGEYIRGISQDILTGTLNLENFRSYTDTEKIIGELTKIRGIGRWTAELTILRGLHRPDAFPADDIGVRRFIAQFYLNNKKKYLQMRPVLLQSDGETGKDLLRTILKSQICWESPPLHRRKSLT